LSVEQLLQALENSVSFEPASPPSPSPATYLPPKKTGLIIWAVASLVFIVAVIAALVIGGVGNLASHSVDFEIPTSPVMTSAPVNLPEQNEQLNFLVRPYNELTDSGIPALWNFVSSGGSDLDAPGHYYREASVPYNYPTRIRMGWCATDQAILMSNLSSMEFYVSLDGKDIPASQFSVLNTPQSGMVCWELSAIISGLSQGTHIYVETTRVNGTIFDGAGNTSAGDYIYEVKINVR
jgi:hypothetical protein